MELWLRRYKNGELWIFEDHPGYYPNQTKEWLHEHGIHCFYIDESLFPEVTFENSPQKVELKLIKE